MPKARSIAISRAPSNTSGGDCIELASLRSLSQLSRLEAAVFRALDIGFVSIVSIVAGLEAAESGTSSQ
jgi:hypothetical protein